MNIRKTALALVTMALALMGVASSAAAATDGVVRDVTTNAIISESQVLHLVGWTEFVNESGDGAICHATANFTPTGNTGTTGHTTMTVSESTKCKGTGALAQCSVTGVHTTNGPYHITITPNAPIPIDATGTIVFHYTYSGFLCPPVITLTFSEIKIKPLNTTNKRVVTNTLGNLGNTAAAGEPIAGGELSGTGESHSILGTEQITASGELEVQGTNRCTYKIQAS